MIKRYSELILLPTFEERFEYLKCGGAVGIQTFAGHRWLNQEFYTSREWKIFKDKIIERDGGCDLGVTGYEIYDRCVIHHINPLTVDILINNPSLALDPENVICCCDSTHRAIHYGNIETTKYKVYEVIERKPNDTCPWR